jgi:hypothetical protein
MENEFHGLTVCVSPFSSRLVYALIHLTQLTCDGAYIIPRNAGNADKYPYDVASYRTFLEYLYIV